MPVIWENEAEGKVKIPQTREEALKWLDLTATGASEDKIKKAYRKLALKWHPDKWGSKPEKEQKKASDIFSAITVAFEILEDKDDDLKVYCSLCWAEILGKEAINGMRGKLFCSQEHAEDFAEDFDPNRPCRICEVRHNKSQQQVPEICEALLSVISKLKNLSHWRYFSDEEKIRFSLGRIQGARDFNFPSEDFDQYVKKTLVLAEAINKEKKEISYQERDKWIQKLKNLDGWDLIEEIQQIGFIEDMGRGKDASHFSSTFERAKKLIKQLRGDGGDEERLKVEIQKAIQEVKDELSREPKVSEEGLGFSWKSYLKKSVSLDELIDRKEEIIGNILTVRKFNEQGDLSQLRKEAILQIRRSLTEDPPIEAEELSVSDWEEKIRRASSTGEISKIKSKILAEIRSKRNNDSEKDYLDDLLSQAHEQQNWNNYQSLLSILREIKQLRASEIYQEKKSEVKVVEKQLQTLDPDRYKEAVEELLKGLIGNEMDDGSSMDQETEQIVDVAKADPTTENLDKAEEAICKNGAYNRLNKLCQKVETELSKERLTEKERDNLIDEIQRFISKGGYQRGAYERIQAKVDALFDRLSGWEDQDKEEEQPWLEKILLPIVIVCGLGVAMSIVIWLISGKRKMRKK